jgi:hypothetical protein
LAHEQLEIWCGLGKDDLLAARRRFLVDAALLDQSR